MPNNQPVLSSVVFIMLQMLNIQKKEKKKKSYKAYNYLYMVMGQVSILTYTMTAFY